ncbi:MAG: CPBP family intramembrane metalloprotease [Eubacteriales bacterium]|nr:CPBP family intramembrane metalloprotease [Eubacteriales bacterium]
MNKKYHVIRSILLPGMAILWGFLYYRILYNRNMLLSLDDISTNILTIVLQHILVNLPIILLLLITGKRMGGKRFFFMVPSKKVWKIAWIICVILYGVLLFYALQINRNWIKVLYIWIFYLLFVSFMEEYLYRGLIPALEKNKLPKGFEWIVPNVLFTLSHYVMLFVEPSGIHGITISTLIRFFITTMIFGIVMELLKRKSNSLYIPVFVHAIYDFYEEIMLWV